jgi:hypothetical protein
MSNKEIHFAAYDDAIKLFEMALESGASAQQAVELVKECKFIFINWQYRMANAKK